MWSLGLKNPVLVSALGQSSAGTGIHIAGD